MLRSMVENSLQPPLSSAPLQELVVTLDEQNGEFYQELNECHEESLSGGGDLARSVLIRPGGNAYVIERREI